MPITNSDFQTMVKSAAGLLNNSQIRAAYGFSNCAKFVPGGFLCGIPNLESLNEATGTICVCSKIHLSPYSELHTAIVVRKNFQGLLDRLKAMVASPEDFFANKNNNCAVFLGSDGKIYVYNKAKDTAELTPDLLKKIGPGVEPDGLYWAFSGNEKNSEDETINQIRKLIDSSKFIKIAIPESTTYGMATNLSNHDISSVTSDFVSMCKVVKFETSVNLVQRYIASLLAKRLLVLTGLAGSGKTKLAQAFSRWLAKSSECFHVVPVGADWTGNV